MAGGVRVRRLATDRSTRPEIETPAAGRGIRLPDREGWCGSRILQARHADAEDFGAAAERPELVGALLGGSDVVNAGGCV
ncbi:hypothetical protein GGQ63_003918 [Prosthecomicrobium pneumaticum]|uniref:Uncharacterized protein n=1 Tax=Prosthecomicrobium pneumaticum TaxID=81895 RepID=A0A7W9FQD0_9HYPH|nr:hypothetical protein [Prosthecomicrobium pneumaticum]